MFFCVSKGEIDAHEDSFRATDEAGQTLLNTGHYASEEVKEKVVSRLYVLLCDILTYLEKKLKCIMPIWFMVSCMQLGILSEEKESLLELWEVRRQQYEQCMDLQLFYRDTEQVDNWMSKQEVTW